MRVVISGSDPPVPDAAVFVAVEPAAGALADTAAGAGETAADGDAGCAGAAEPLTSVAWPSSDLGVFGADALPGVDAFPAAPGDDVAGGLGAAGGCAAMLDEFVSFGAEESPWGARTGAFCDPAPPCDPFPEGALGAGGGGAGFCFFSSEGL